MRRLRWVERRSLKVAFFALCMGLAGLIFYFIGISMGWLYVRYLLLSQNHADGS